MSDDTKTPVDKRFPHVRDDVIPADPRPKVVEPRAPPLPPPRELSPALAALLEVLRPLAELARTESHLNCTGPCASRWAALAAACELVLVTTGHALAPLAVEVPPPRRDGGEAPRSPGER